MKKVAKNNSKKKTQKKGMTKEDGLLMEVAKFILDYSNVCWNLGEKGEYKKAQELGVDELMARMPKLAREFLAEIAVEDSPFLDTIEILDEGLKNVKKTQKKSKAATKRKTKAS